MKNEDLKQPELTKEKAETAEISAKLTENDLEKVDGGVGTMPKPEHHTQCY
jgi:hypothetical protein